MTVIDIMLLVLIIVAIIVCVYLVLTLKKVTATLEEVVKDVHKLSGKILPLLENLNEVSKKAVYITSEAEKHVEDFNSAVNNAKQKFCDFTSGVASRGSNPENPAGNLIKILTGISRGIAVFWKNYKKN